MKQLIKTGVKMRGYNLHRLFTFGVAQSLLLSLLILNLPHSIAPANTQSRVYTTRHWKRSVHYEEQAYKQTNRFPVVACTSSIPAFNQLLALPDPRFVGLFILTSLHSIVHAYIVTCARKTVPGELGPLQGAWTDGIFGYISCPITILIPQLVASHIDSQPL